MLEGARNDRGNVGRIHETDTIRATSSDGGGNRCDPLTWWKIHKVNFLNISRLARKYLCIPATSVPSERVFSTGGNVVTCQRSALKPATVNMLVFLTKNLKV